MRSALPLSAVNLAKVPAMRSSIQSKAPQDPAYPPRRAYGIWPCATTGLATGLHQRAPVCSWSRGRHPPRRNPQAFRLLPARPRTQGHKRHQNRLKQGDSSPKSRALREVAGSGSGRESHDNDGFGGYCDTQDLGAGYCHRGGKPRATSRMTVQTVSGPGAQSLRAASLVSNGEVPTYVHEEARACRDCH